MKPTRLLRTQKIQIILQRAGKACALLSKDCVLRTPFTHTAARQDTPRFPCRRCTVAMFFGVKFGVNMRTEALSVIGYDKVKTLQYLLFRVVSASCVPCGTVFCDNAG